MYPKEAIDNFEKSTRSRLPEKIYGKIQSFINDSDSGIFPMRVANINNYDYDHFTYD